MLSLTIVVPCFNEQEVLFEAINRLDEILCDLINNNKVAGESRIVFIDDGSRDTTWQIVEQSARNRTRVGGIKLSRNFGHQRAVLAGLLTVKSDAVISIDADLQDDINVIGKMVDEHIAGNEIVYGVRRRRSSDSYFKRATAEGYYRLLRLMGVDIVFNHADYRLMGKNAIEALRDYEEVNLFLRGIVPTIGFSSSIVEYDRHERLAGKSKYPLRKMLALAIDGITSFSATPLRFIAGLGMLVFIGSMLMSIWVLWTKFVTGEAIPGWTSSVLPMYFLGGIQLFAIGVVGEYVSKIYLETKRRPRFIVDKMIGFDRRDASIRSEDITG